MDSQTDFLKMQSKLRNNNEDLESFMREINSWQEEMSAKDTQLAKGFTGKTATNDDKENSHSVLIQRASVEKDKGNDFFKKGEYQKAVDCYTEGLKCDPRSAILAANRAMALLKLDREKEAEKDCTLAISLDPTYAKAYIRRAYARSGLKRYSDAITDYEKVLEIEPKNKMAKMEIEKLIRRQESGGEPAKKSVKSAASSFEENMKNAFQKKSSKPASNKIGEEEPHCEGSNFLRPVSTKKLSDSNSLYPCEKPPHMRSKKPLKRMHIVDVTNEEKPPKDIVENIIEKDLSKSLEEIVQVSSPKPSQPKNLAKPNSSVQFYCTWRSLANDTQRKSYLSLIPPKEYASLFKHSLESDVFSGMLRVLKGEFLPDAELKNLVPDILLSLSRVERLSVLLMFLGSEERECLNAILGSIEEGSTDPTKMKEINKHFC